MASRTKQAKKQAKKLRKNAQSLWSDQQALLDRANTLARDAWPQAQHFAKHTVVPGAKTIYEDRVQPTLGKGAVAGKAAGTFVGSTARDAVRGTVVPAATSAAAAALALANEASERLGASGDRNAAAIKTLDKVTRSGNRSELKARAKLKGAAKAGKVAAKAGSKRVAKATGRDSGGLGAGGIIGIVLGALVVGGIAYAVWQTLRADDDLWVADEDPETPTTEPPAA